MNRKEHQAIIHVKAVAPRNKFSFRSCNCLTNKAVLSGLCWVHLYRPLNGPGFARKFCFSHDTSAQGTSQSLQEFHGHLQMQEAFQGPQSTTTAPRAFIPREWKAGRGSFSRRGVIKMLMSYLKRKTFDFWEENSKMKTFNFFKWPETWQITQETPQPSEENGPSRFLLPSDHCSGF